MRFDVFDSLKHLTQGGMCEIAHGKLKESSECVLKYPITQAAQYETAKKDVEQELLLLQLLHHPHIITLLGAGKTPEGDTFLCLEYLSHG